MKFVDILIHLRFPFSLFLLPVALLGLHAAGELEPGRAVLVLLSIHLFLYPASNAFNSYYDRDEGPIGGIAAPPKVDKKLLVASLFVDALGILVGFFVSPAFALGLFVYGLFSKAYSWDKIRWKKRPLVSLIGIALVQGSFTFLLCALSAGRVAPLIDLGDWRLLGSADFRGLGLGALCSAAFLLAVYPLTQVYQHEEDRGRGDLSYSLWVGLKGTFVSSGVFLLFAAFGFYFYFGAGRLAAAQGSLVPGPLVVLATALAPALVFFFWWWARVVADEKNADFRKTMFMNSLASLGMNAALLLILLCPDQVSLLGF